MWLLVTGTGRCGTGYISQVLTSAGVNCSHEGVFDFAGWNTALERIRLRAKNPSWDWQADASWLAAPFLSRPELAAMTVVHLVRHPKAVMDSHLRLTLYSPDTRDCYRWIAQFIPEIENCDWPQDKAALCYVRINELCEARADIRHRIEDTDTILLDKLGIGYAGKMLFDNRMYNTRSGYGPSNVQIEDVAQPLRDELLKISERYGYSWDGWEPKIVTAVWIGRTVQIDEQAAHIGGGWQIRDGQGRPMAYDLGLLEFFARQIAQVKDPVILDIGASTGSFTLLPLIVGGRVIAFEPNPIAFRSLEATIMANDLGDSVELHRYAVGGGTGSVRFNVPEQALHMAVSTVGKPRRAGLKWNTIEVNQVTIDSLDLDHVDFMKIDTEGSELQVLAGAEQTIKRHKPGILVEYTSLNTRQCGYEREEIKALLERWGYTEFRQVGIEDLWCTY